MLIEEKEYVKPQFELVVIESVDIMAISFGDNDVSIEQLLSGLNRV